MLGLKPKRHYLLKCLEWLPKVFGKDSKKYSSGNLIFSTFKMYIPMIQYNMQ